MRNNATTMRMEPPDSSSNTSKHSFKKILTDMVQEDLSPLTANCLENTELTEMAVSESPIQSSLSRISASSTKISCRTFAANTNKVVIKQNLPNVPRMKLVSKIFVKISRLGFMRTQKGLIFSCMTNCKFKCKNTTDFVEHLLRHHDGMTSFSEEACCSCNYTPGSWNYIEEADHLIKVHLRGHKGIPIEVILYSSITLIKTFSKNFLCPDDQCSQEISDKTTSFTDSGTNLVNNACPATKTLNSQENTQKKPDVTSQHVSPTESCSMPVISHSPPSIDQTPLSTDEILTAGQNEPAFAPALEKSTKKDTKREVVQEVHIQDIKKEEEDEEEIISDAETEILSDSPAIDSDFERSGAGRKAENEKDLRSNPKSQWSLTSKQRKVIRKKKSTELQNLFSNFNSKNLRLRNPKSLRIFAKKKSEILKQSINLTPLSPKTKTLGNKDDDSVNTKRSKSKEVPLLPSSSSPNKKSRRTRNKSKKNLSLTSVEKNPTLKEPSKTKLPEVIRNGARFFSKSDLSVQEQSLIKDVDEKSNSRKIIEDKETEENNEEIKIPLSGKRPRRLLDDTDSEDEPLKPAKKKSQQDEMIEIDPINLEDSVNCLQQMPLWMLEKIQKKNQTRDFSVDSPAKREATRLFNEEENKTYQETLRPPVRKTYRSAKKSTDNVTFSNSHVDNMLTSDVIQKYKLKKCKIIFKKCEELKTASSENKELINEEASLPMQLEVVNMSSVDPIMSLLQDNLKSHVDTSGMLESPCEPNIDPITPRTSSSENPIKESEETKVSSKPLSTLLLASAEQESTPKKMKRSSKSDCETKIPILLYPWIDDEWVKKWRKTPASVKVLMKEQVLYSTYKCMSIECQFYSTDLQAFASHLEEHSVVDNHFLCSYCLAGFGSPENLIEHLESHKFDRFQCDKCMYRACEKFYVHLHRQKYHDTNASILKSPTQILRKADRGHQKRQLKNMFDEIFRYSECRRKFKKLNIV